jgi:hypothetical protein
MKCYCIYYQTYIFTIVTSASVDEIKNDNKITRFAINFNEMKAIHYMYHGEN